MLLAVMQAKHPLSFAQLRSWPNAALGGSFLVLGMITHELLIPIGVGVGTPLVMGWLLQHPIPGGARTASVLAFLGGTSYALYLWHKDLLLAFGIVGLPIALIAAAASWVFVERPVLNWAHSMTRSRPERLAETPTR
jgi:peptidoglycan/LPS O-acetylase OafA/YrhL